MMGMNKLPLATRVQILTMLCEGSSMRSISRVCDACSKKCDDLPIERNLTRPEVNGALGLPADVS